MVLPLHFVKRRADTNTELPCKAFDERLVTLRYKRFDDSQGGKEINTSFIERSMRPCANDWQLSPAAVGMLVSA